MSEAYKQITVQTLVHAPLETVWNCWTEPQHIQVWNSASPDWHTPHATNDLRVGGTFLSRMEAKDKSAGFDFNGTYTEVTPHASIAYTIEGGRPVQISFEHMADGVQVTERFALEDENSEELQRAGWQAILDHFKQYVESHS